MRSIGPKLPDKVGSMNRRGAVRLRAERLAEVSRRVRGGEHAGECGIRGC